MSLSIALAVHNEENNILRCLEAIYHWVDEIIIVDGGSTDKTVTVIKNYDQDNKIKIFKEPNEAMFHKNKQKAIEQCTKEWILQLDADEIVSKELREEIFEAIKLKSSGGKIPGVKIAPTPGVVEERQPIAFWLPRLNYFLGKPLKKGGQYPDYSIRFYKNGIARFPCKSVHEQVEIIDGKTPGVADTDSPEVEKKHTKSNIGYLKTPLLHFPYPTFDEYLKKWRRYILLEAEMLYKTGVKPSVWNFILYMIIYPKWWFLKTYIRHKGFSDGFAGFAFALFSALRYVASYVQLYELTHDKKTQNNYS